MPPMEDARRGHVEEKPIAAPAGPIARLAPWLPTKCPAACPQHTLFFERPAMSLRTRKLGPTQRPSRGSREIAESLIDQSKQRNLELSEFRVSDRPPGSYAKTGVMSGLATTRNNSRNLRMADQPATWRVDQAGFPFAARLSNSRRLVEASAYRLYRRRPVLKLAP
jgi:hypothetical protein